MATISPFQFAQQNARLQNLLQSDEDSPAARARDQALIAQEYAKMAAAYKSQYGVDVTQADLDGSNLANVPEGWTFLGRQNQDEEGANPNAAQFAKDASGKNYIVAMSEPSAADFANGTAVRAPNGTVYMEYGEAKNRGAAADGGVDKFMVNLPRALATAVPMAGLSGVLGGLQGVQGTSLIPGFDAANFMGGQSPTSLLGGGSGAESLIGQAAGDTLGGAAGGAMDMFGAVNSPLGTGAPGVLGVDSFAAQGLTGGGALNNIINTVQNVPPGTTTAAQQLLNSGGDNTGAMDQTGSVNSPTGAGGGGTVFQQGVGGGWTDDIINGIKALGLDPTKLALGTAKGLLDYFGGKAAGDANQEMFNTMWGAGAPSRARFEGSYAPGWNVMTVDPSLQAGLDSTMETQLRKLSAVGGNPFGNPGGLMEAQKNVMGGFILPATDAYRRTNLAGGQMGFSQAADFGSNNANFAMAPYNAAGTAIGGILGDPMQDLYKKFGQGILSGQYKLDLGG